MSDDIYNWVNQSPYGQALGMTLVALSDDAATIYLPFNEANANPGNALHGGVAASASVTAAHALTRHVLGPDTGPWHTMDFQINYLAAAIGEDISATAHLLRRGREICFMALNVRTDDGKAIAQCSIAVRGRQGKKLNETPLAAGDDGKSFKGIAFRAAESDMGQALLHGSRGRRLWLAGRVKIDDWGNRPQAELHLEDAAWAD